MYNVLKSVKRPDCNICIFKLDPEVIDSVYRIQRFVLRARKAFVEEKSELITIHLLNGILIDVMGEMFYSSHFDKNLWDRFVDSHGSLLRIVLTLHNHTNRYTFDIHFERGIHDCVRIVGDVGGETPWFDIFSAVFRDAESSDILFEKTEIKDATGIRKLDI